MDAPRVRLGELLVKAGLISEQQLREALCAQQEDNRRLGTLLVETGLVSEIQVTQILSQQLSVPWVSLHHIDFSRQLLSLVPEEIVARFRLIPIYVRRVRGLGDTLYVAMDDPTNEQALQEVAQACGLHVRAMIAPPSDILSAIHAYYGVAFDAEEEVVTAVRERAKAPPPPRAAQAQRAKEEAEQRQSRTQIIAESASAPAVAESAGASAGGASSTQPVAGQAAVGNTGQPPPKPAFSRAMVSLTLLDGTTIQVPAKGRESQTQQTEEQITARDLIAALRASVRGADVSDTLGGADVEWEAIVAALLAVLLKKHLIADWEFVEELKKG